MSSPRLVNYFWVLLGLVAAGGGLTAFVTMVQHDNANRRTCMERCSPYQAHTVQSGYCWCLRPPED